ncbi:nicotinate-nucleotide pyrophosphorylase [carboxylating] [Anaerobacterium chartisolvens]|uniref:Probable nicotinate-nucleotide pyrophosphorylase [carboxylating] n=1 Tax=Anaerobacterium chartisolvens TaxID=1297424 RepID=A0A369AF51_9FIRM|nr:carboxylating nicotinate-nucleotide diphosphorylase [Anaerobacterium chartisolvens]RCX07811.1 nicotinate-nucleotide pyrophosphorylase [carboxylating] [Anaerobacterium chartisolvens]
MLDKMYIDRLIMTALKEDMPMGDITTDSLIASSAVSKAQLIAKENGIIAGLDVAKRTFAFLDEDISIALSFKDGDFVKAGQIIAVIEGNTRAILKAERTALNFLQRLSGIATKTGEFCEKIKDLPAIVVDTRKTTCGLRVLEKYAVRAGGGQNHRFCLSDGVLIKDNHIRAAGGIKKAVETARGHIPHTIKIEVETETIAQVNEALEARADIIMLDNMDYETMREAVRHINKRALVEASGNVSLDTIYDIAALGVDIISVGALTHTVKALDISLRFI